VRFTSALSIKFARVQCTTRGERCSLGSPVLFDHQDPKICELR
jgi:hypothetical protein